MAPVLFTASTLTALSGREVTDEVAAAIHAWVVTELEAEIGTLTDPALAGVAAVAVELGAAAVPPPGGASSTTLGSFSASYATDRPGPALSREQRRRLRRAVGKDRAFIIDTTQSG